MGTTRLTSGSGISTAPPPRKRNTKSSSRAPPQNRPSLRRRPWPLPQSPPHIRQPCECSRARNTTHRSLRALRPRESELGLCRTSGGLATHCVESGWAERARAGGAPEALCALGADRSLSVAALVQGVVARFLSTKRRSALLPPFGCLLYLPAPEEGPVEKGPVEQHPVERGAEEEAGGAMEDGADQAMGGADGGPIGESSGMVLVISHPGAYRRINSSHSAFDAPRSSITSMSFTPMLARRNGRVQRTPPADAREEVGGAQRRLDPIDQSLNVLSVTDLRQIEGIRC